MLTNLKLAVGACAIFSIALATDIGTSGSVSNLTDLNRTKLEENQSTDKMSNLKFPSENVTAKIQPRSNDLIHVSNFSEEKPTSLNERSDLSFTAETIGNNLTSFPTEKTKNYFATTETVAKPTLYQHISNYERSSTKIAKLFKENGPFSDDLPSYQSKNEPSVDELKNRDISRTSPDLSSQSPQESSIFTRRKSAKDETTASSLTTSITSTPTGVINSVWKGAIRSRNELVAGTFQETKPSRKVNVYSNLNSRYGGNIVKPNIPSVLGKYAPYFEDGEDEVNITTRVGNTVLLNCNIGMLGNKTVTWSYHSKEVFRLLTVGRNAYSVDERINLHFRYPTNWRLRIQYATARDSGLYECQVATYPPLVKKIYLLVAVPVLEIMDDLGKIKSGERHLKAGSALRLRCEARDVPEQHNETVIWTRGDEILTEDVSENRTIEYVDGREIEVVISTIVIDKATPKHAGNYSCSVPEKAKATIAVHVLNGELPAAVHDGNGASRSVLNLWLIHLTISYVFSR